MLLDRGADAGIKDGQGRTALEAGRRESEENMVGSRRKSESTFAVHRRQRKWREAWEPTAAVLAPRTAAVNVY